MRDRGAGTLGAAVGLTVSFALLVVAVHLAARLHHTATVSALGAEAAHEVAHAGPGADGAARRAGAAQRLAGLLGPSADISWTFHAEGASVRVAMPGASVVGLPGRVERSADARWERVP